MLIADLSKWLMDPAITAEAKQSNVDKWQAMSKFAVENSIKAIREMVADGRINV